MYLHRITPQVGVRIIPIISKIHGCFSILHVSPLPGGADVGGLVPVDPSRFQVLDVDERCDIRTYVQKNGLIFKPGRGFYEFTKPEKISDKKEVVLVDKVGL